MKKIFKNPYQFTSAGLLFLSGLLFMPGNPLPGQNPAAGESGLSLKQVNSITVDRENTKWFSTDAGIISFDGKNWKLYDDNTSIPKQDVRSLASVDDPRGQMLWMASPLGATVAGLPMDDQTGAMTYNPDNSPMISQDVLAVAAGQTPLCWIGTARGVSALNQDLWLKPDYDMHYPESVFELFPITSMATNTKGDSLYVGTSGGGVARVFRDNLDGISGASVYAQWGPIDLPSDNIRSVYIAPDGTKWFGTSDGIARHTGDNTLDNWTVFTTDDGLVDNFVQAISADHHGNIWFGTPAGISVFDGSSWISYTTENGLAGNNILSLATDKNGMVWIGTDEGISSFENGKFISY